MRGRQNIKKNVESWHKSARRRLSAEETAERVVCVADSHCTEVAQNLCSTVRTLLADANTLAASRCQNCRPLLKRTDWRTSPAD